MSITHIQQKYNALGLYQEGMQITIDQDFTGSAELKTIMEAVLGQDSITMTCSALDPLSDDNHLEISGTASLLNMAGANMHFSAWALNGDFLVKLVIEVPSGWKFTDSFPFLPNRYDLSKPDAERVQPNLLNSLSLGTCKLVFTNKAHHDSSLNADLVSGLNFVGELYLMGMLTTLGQVLGDDEPVQVSGPIIEYKVAPEPMDFMGVRLSAALPLSMDSFPLPLTNPGIYIKSLLYMGQYDPTVGIMKDPGVYITADATIDGQAIKIVSQYHESSRGLMLNLHGRVSNFALSGFSSLSQSAGGEGIEADLPSEMQAPSGLQLTELGLGVNLTNPAITSAMIGVGFSTNWELIPGTLSIEEIGLNFRVIKPFNNQLRKMFISLSGTIAIGDVKLVAFGEFPSYRIGAGLPEGETIPLGNLIEQFLPSSAPDLPEMTIDKLLFTGFPKQHSYYFNANISDVLSIPVGDTSFDIEGINVLINKSASTTTGSLHARMSMAEVTATLTADFQETFTFTGVVSNLNLKKLWTLTSGGESLPEEVPDITFETITIMFSPGTGSFSMRGTIATDWDKLPFDGTLSTTVEFSFHSQKASGAGKATVTASLSFQGTGPAELADELLLKNFNFLFEYTSGQSWKLGGGATLDIFDHELYLDASYEDSSTTGKVFQLTTKATPEVKLIDLQGIGSFSFSQLDLKIQRKTVEGKTQTFWDFRLDSSMAIDNVFTIAGFLSIYSQANGRKGLLFNPDAGTADGTVDFPGGGGVKLSLFEAGISRESADSGWGFTATVDMGFVGMPDWMGSMLPSKLRAKLVANSNTVSIAALDVTDVIPIKLPKVDGKAMGTIYFQLTQAGVSVKPTAGLVLEAGLGFSKEVNNLFGGTEVFRVYQKDNKLSMARTRFNISESGITVQFITSPFAAANSVVVNGETWVNIDLGKTFTVA